MSLLLLFGGAVINTTVTPSTASLATTMFAPTVIIGTVATPPTLPLATQAYAPTIVNPQGVVVPPASLTTSPFAPVPAVDRRVEVPTVALATQGFAPELKLVITPPLAELATTPYAPTVTVGQLVIPPTASLTTATFIPIVGLSIIPPTMSLATTSFAPQLQHVVTPPALALSLTTFVPVIRWAIIPGTAHLVIGLPGAVTVIVRQYPRGVRVEIWADGVRVGGGPLKTVQGLRYSPRLDKIGTASVQLSSMDPQYSYLTGRVEVRLYIAGEGLVFRGPLLAKDGAPFGPATLELASLEEELIGEPTGLGRVFDEASNGAVIAGLLSGTDWAYQVGATDVLYSKRIDNRTIWQALADYAYAVGGHIRADTITDAAGVPTKGIELITGTAESNGLIFKTVGKITPEMAADNRTVIPIEVLSVRQESGELWNRIVALGPGNGYPMLTLKDSQLGANLCTNASFEDGTTDGWSHGNASLANSATYAKSGTKSLRVTRTGGALFYASFAHTLTGATAGKVFSGGFWFYGDATVVGKTGTIEIAATGGAGASDDVAVTFTIVAGWQFVTMELPALNGNARTALTLYAIVTSSTASDLFYIDRVTLWESTDFAYCVENEIGAGGVREDFIEAVDSVEAHGRRTKYLAIKDAVPTEVGIDAYYAAKALMTRRAGRFLDLHKEPITRYQVRPYGLKHVEGGEQLIKPGQSSRLMIDAPIIDPGETEARSAMRVDTTVTNLGWDRSIDSSMKDEWTLELSTVDLPAMDDAALIAQLVGDFDGSESDVKPYNYTFPIDVVLEIPAGEKGYFPIPMKDVLAIHHATLTIQQMKGTTVNSDLGLQVYSDGGATAIAITGGTDWDDATEYDITLLLTQWPTPVPALPTTVTTYLGDYEGLVLQVDPGTDAAAQDTAFSVVMEIQVSKLTTAPA